jgi:2-dehydropantoate 2-reductase
VARIAVFGAGAIGCWIGGRLAAGGVDVTLIGRPRLIDEAGDGLAISELGGGSWTVRPRLATEASAAAGADVVLVTVKSAATAEAARALAPVAPSPVLSLQNGVRNVEVLRAGLPGRRVVAGMVPYNVVRVGPGAYHRASSGTLVIEELPAFVAACRAAGVPLEVRRDLASVQWAKLVMNLNNAINALSGLPLASELADRDFRRCLAAAQREALAVLEAAQVPIAQLGPLPPRWIARLLPLPDAVFRRLARRLIAIDPRARSSMWDDLEARRATEIDYIQGEVVALGDRTGIAAPVNRALIALVRAAETGGKRDFTGRELRAALGLMQR